MLTRISLFFCLSGAWVCAQDLPQVPPLTSPVIDQAKIFSAEERRSLEAEIHSYLPHVQFQVWTLPTLNGMAIEELSMQAVETWKLGSEANDNGLLLLIVPNDRKVRIEVGQGLEGSIPDVVASRSIREILTPHFRDNLFYEGTLATLRRLYTRATGMTSKETPEEARLVEKRATSKKLSNGIVMTLIILIFIFSWFGPSSRRFSRRRGWGGGYGGGGFGGGGFGGGGWSGGGGGFSGEDLLVHGDL